MKTNIYNVTVRREEYASVGIRAGSHAEAEEICRAMVEDGQIDLGDYAKDGGDAEYDAERGYGDAAAEPEDGCAND